MKWWQKFRNEIIEERGHRCERCYCDANHRWNRLILHHIKPRYLFCMNSMDFGTEFHVCNFRENLILLCNSCHRTIHNQMMWCEEIVYDMFYNRRENMRESNERDTTSTA